MDLSSETCVDGRRFRHYSVEAPAKLESADESATEQISVEVVIRDISCGGAQIEIDHPLTEESTWRLCFAQSGRTQDSFPCVVKHCRSERGKYRAGVEFIIESGLLSLLGVVEQELAKQSSATTSRKATPVATDVQAGHCGFILASDSLTVDQLHALEGHIGKDLNVKTKIVYCQLRIDGDLVLPQGVLIGGKTRVGGRMCVGELGSLEGDETIVHVGGSAEAEKIQEQVKEHLAELDRQVQDQTDTIERLQANSASPTHNEREEITVLMCEQAMLQETRNRIEEKGNQLRATIQQACSVDLTILKLIHPGARLIVGKTVAVFDEQIVGPVRIGLDADGNLVLESIESGRKSPLAETAQISRKAA